MVDALGQAGDVLAQVGRRALLFGEVANAAHFGAQAADLARQAQGHFRRATEAQRAGDWALYGEEIQRLGEVLERINAGR